jgi:hypothetical protein
MVASERAAYSGELFDFPAVISPIATTCVLSVLHGLLALWLVRASGWELMRAAACCPPKTAEKRPLDNRALVLCLACAASLASLCHIAFKFVPTLVHATLRSDTLTVAASLVVRAIGAVGDSLWFGATAQLVAYWLELLSAMRAVKRVKKCCWFSTLTSSMFALLRMVAAIVAPFSRGAQVSLLALALLVAWAVTACGTVAALRLCCHMRQMVAKNCAAKAIRVKMFRICRFLAVNGALFVLLNLALVLTAIGTGATARSAPVAVLAWEAPTELGRFAFFVSLAWSCSSSSRRPTARGALAKRAKSVTLKAQASLASMRTSLGKECDGRGDGGGALPETHGSEGGGTKERRASADARERSTAKDDAHDAVIVYDLSLVTVRDSAVSAEPSQRGLGSINPLLTSWAAQAQRSLAHLEQMALRFAEGGGDGGTSIDGDGNGLRDVDEEEGSAAGEPVFERRAPRRPATRSASAPSTAAPAANAATSVRREGGMRTVTV